MGAFSVKNRSATGECADQRVVLANVWRIIVEMGGRGNTGLLTVAPWMDWWSTAADPGVEQQSFHAGGKKTRFQNTPTPQPEVPGWGVGVRQ
jgi:hypothetical protein